MRARLLVLVVVAMSCTLFAGTAGAQKDPFHPVIDPDAATTTTTTTTTTGSTTDGVYTPPSVGSEGIANTGADAEPWLVIAYGLIVIGGGALAVARLQDPRPTRR